MLTGSPGAREGDRCDSEGPGPLSPFLICRTGEQGRAALGLAARLEALEFEGHFAQLWAQQ